MIELDMVDKKKYPNELKAVLVDLSLRHKNDTLGGDLPPTWH